MLKYCALPTSVMGVLSGKSYALHVLCLLCSKQTTHTKRTHFIAKSWISEFTGISLKQVYRSITMLEELGLIELVAIRRGEYMWYLKCLELLESSEKSDDELAVELAALMDEVNQI